MRRFSSSQNEPQQRLAVTFSRGEELKYISHLDIMRLWQRALRRAGMPVAYTQGFNPRPRIAIAAPLAIGVTSEGELMDVFMQRKAAPDFFARAVGEQLPQGVRIMGIREVWPKLPSVQSQLRFAEYEIELETDLGSEEVGELVRTVLEKENLPWQHAREKQIRHYDLRGLIEDIWIIDWDSSKCTLGMRLRNDAKAAGRPEQVVLAIGFSDPPLSIHRTRLILDRN